MFLECLIVKSNERIRVGAGNFSDKNSTPAFDGMSTNIIILYSDEKVIQINPLNTRNERQRELYNEILNLIIEKHTNKNDSIILQKIKGYR